MMASDLHTINSSVFSEFSPPYSYQLDTFPSTPQLANLSTRNKVQESNLQESALNWSQLTDLPSCITDDCIFHSAGTKIRGELGTMKSNIKTNASQRSTDCSSRTGRIGEYNPFIETPFSFEELDLNYASMQRTNTQGNKRNVDGSIKPQQFSKNREQENDEEDIFFSGLV